MRYVDEGVGVEAAVEATIEPHDLVPLAEVPLALEVDDRLHAIQNPAAAGEKKVENRSYDSRNGWLL